MFTLDKARQMSEKGFQNCLKEERDYIFEQIKRYAKNGYFKWRYDLDAVLLQREDFVISELSNILIALGFTVEISTLGKSLTIKWNH